MDNYYYVYILTNKYNKVLYVGVTNNLIRRVWEHRNGNDKNSFTKKYNLSKLVYYEIFEDVSEAILREKRIKGGSRQRKINLISNFNSEWKDFYEEMSS